MTLSLSPELAFGIWLFSSVCLGLLLEARLGRAHAVCGIISYTIEKFVRWRSTALWKLLTLPGLLIFGIGMRMFLAPWAHEGYRADFWGLYNQTYRWTYHLSLRVAWVTCVGLLWVVMGILGGSLSRATTLAPDSKTAYCF